MKRKYNYLECENIIRSDYNLVINDNAINLHLIKKLNNIIINNDLSIVFIILSHDKQYTGRCILNTVDLINNIPLSNVSIYLGFQGNIENNMKQLLINRKVTIINNHKLISEEYKIDLCKGKSENMFSSLFYISRLHEELKTFVLTLDSDYYIYDYINLLALITPWILSFENDYYQNVEFVKGSGLFIHPLSKDQLSLDKQGMLSYGDVVNSYLEDKITEEVYITPKNIRDLLDKNQIKKIEDNLLSDFIIGGRIGRSFCLSQILNIGSTNGRNFSKFRYILHGNQGTTLYNWNLMNLSKGYGLEISFLFEFLYNNIFFNKKIVDLEILPISHDAKSFKESMLIGVDIFSLYKKYQDFIQQEKTICSNMEVLSSDGLFDIEIHNIVADNKLDLLPSVADFKVK